MSRPKIKTALTGIFLITALAVAALSWFAMTGMQILQANTAAIASDRLPSVSIARQIETAIAGQRLVYAKHILTVNKDEMTKANGVVEAQTKRVRSALEAYAPLASTDVENSLLAEIVADFDAYQKLGTELLELSNDGDKDFAKALLNGEMAKTAEKTNAVVAQLVSANMDAAAAAFAESQKTYDFVSLEIMITIAVSALVILGSIVFVLRGIARPIQSITGAMTTLARGDTASRVPFAGRRDEIGEMAGAVEVFRQAAIANKQLEEDATTARLQADKDRVRLQAEAEAGAQERLIQATAGLATGLKRLAAGDLSFELSEPFAPDFEALRHDLNAAVGQLGETLLSVADATSQIDSGSREISRSADDLSRRTEQQAASLEETAAALDQITANVSNSSKRADEARHVAVEANASAAQSGKVVANAVDAMQKIEQSSSQISNIIGVIDEIAFQTNLLALNAGVEAARAGDAGKGFAVVAQEVRELAQRSAQAAKEIKELIRNSSTQVQGGVKLVRDTGEALKTIEGFIVTINQHMDAIATSAREQSVGLAEVNTAVNQMDQVTQQNAAMVEETNAASATLATESGKLRELIGQFNLGGGAQQQQVASLRQTAAVMAQPSRRPAPVPARAAAPVRAKAVSHGSAAVAQDDWEEF